MIDMRRIAIVVFSLAVAALPCATAIAQAQPDVNNIVAQRGATSVYGDLLGTGLLYALGVEHIFGGTPRFGFRAGTATFEVKFFTKSRVWLFPVTALTVPRRGRIGFELGAGPTFAIVSKKGEGKFGRGGVAGHLLVGVRFNDRPASRWIVRLNGMMFFNTEGALAWPGLGMSYRL